MHHCFATTARREIEFEFQIVPDTSGRIMLLCVALRNFLEK
jgi:hypothetical protein